MLRDGDITTVDRRLLDELTTIVSMAAAAILAAARRLARHADKADLSPVTAADHAAEAVILEGLGRVLAGRIASCRRKPRARRRPASIPASFVLVDPLDGTRELVAGRDEFTVNVAIVTGGRPRLGIVAAPAQGLLWRGLEGQGAERMRLPPGAPARARAGTHRHPHPAGSGRGPGRSGQPLASRPRNRGVPGPAADRRAPRMRVGGQILPRRRGRRRRLSAALDRPANGTWPPAMRCSRPPAARWSRRGNTVALRPRRRELPHPRLRGLGRSLGTESPRGVSPPRPARPQRPDKIGLEDFVAPPRS